ncbi:nucleotidyltransferase domain-containing protein, partial [Deinococcus arenae]|uniref:nucleotidyltransferase domain-containing protein n=1 Tax=Deinococcus arenae TaxID=1452751 RepID=UPI001E4F4EE3
MSEPVPQMLLQHLVAELCAEPVQAIALSGSYARGQADIYSDLDLVCYVPQCEDRLRSCEAGECGEASPPRIC